MALVSALSVLMVLTVPMLTLLSTSALERSIARNLVDARQAFFVAEAGLEWAFNRLVDTQDWSTLLGSAAPNPVSLVPPSGLLPWGTATVSVRGHPTDPDSVVVTSSSIVNRARRTIEAVVKRSRDPSNPTASAQGIFPRHSLVDWREG